MIPALLEFWPSLPGKFFLPPPPPFSDILAVLFHKLILDLPNAKPSLYAPGVSDCPQFCGKGREFLLTFSIH